MGGDRTSKEKKKKRMSPLSDPEDEGRSKRHRASGDDTKRSKLKESKEEKSSHSKSSHKHSKRHSNKEKKSEGKHRNRHAKHDGHTKFELVELSMDDYYSKNNEFATWLKEERKLFFSDLSSEMARQLFSEFVEDWNHHKLEIKYYEGIAVGTRTAHKWKIKH
ncbi:hypothetical protein Nepgr_012514 [Nepenthes gracilis]|uniref:Uncharacterized protein n=1 Tax=Nepenthes gracilis TaxID=150966 RepID=A0AAD3SG40_NEPGR|nr:hypothetical protein Nepgr_012514 [Nepenthes gracilis]